MVLPSVMAVNSCGQVGKTFTDVTALAASSTLSIIRSDNQKPNFKLDEIDCPEFKDNDPISVLLRTQFQNAEFLRRLDPAFNNCTARFDINELPIIPIRPLHPAPHESPRGGHGHPRLHHRRDTRNLRANEP